MNLLINTSKICSNTVNIIDITKLILHNTVNSNIHFIRESSDENSLYLEYIGEILKVAPIINNILIMESDITTRYGYVHHQIVSNCTIVNDYEELKLILNENQL